MINLSAVNDGILLGGDTKEWVSALPNYQRLLIEEMLKTQSPTEVAIAWLTSSGPMDTAPFGAVRGGPTLFYGNLLKEIQKLLCGDEGYEAERANLVGIGSTSKMALVGVISTALAPHVGAAAVVLGPAVTMALAVLANAGHETVCEALAAKISDF